MENEESAGSIPSTKINIHTAKTKEIKEGAIFVADSHYPHHGDAFLMLLKKLESGEIVTPQLFLMGDNFDLLFGYNNYIQSFSSEAILLLQQLSTKFEIYYFEGNHDFLLTEIFPYIKVYPRESQPVIFQLGDQRAGLSHGDRYALGWKYNLYCRIQRSRWFFKLLNPFGKWLIDQQIAKMKQKNICHPMQNFEERVEAILANYGDADLVIEGHYHEGRTVGKYISLPSLACQKQIGVIRDGKLVFESLKNYA